MINYPLLQKEKELEIAAKIGQTLLKKVGTLEDDLCSAQSNCHEMEHKVFMITPLFKCYFFVDHALFNDV